FGRRSVALGRVGLGRLRARLLRERRRCEHGQACRKQPRGLADHVSLPCWARPPGERLILIKSERKRARLQRHANRVSLTQNCNRAAELISARGPSASGGLPS